MRVNLGIEEDLLALETTIRTILPEEYQDSYDEIQPVSMGSAGLKYGWDGKVAWDEIWGTFCDLAMAGGPPHKGMLLEPGFRVEIEAQADRYQQVVDEICRGTNLVTGLEAEPSPVPGWVRVKCESEGMAAWLVRAIVMENISARWEGIWLDVPAGPRYRVEKEIKNVITAIAKTTHYWLEHMWSGQQDEISQLFAKMDSDMPLVQPALAGDDVQVDKHQVLRGKIAEAVLKNTGLKMSKHKYATGWLGLQCPSVRAAIWMMRAMVASNVLARREEKVLFVPVNEASDPTGEMVVGTVAKIYGFAAARKVL